MDRPRALPWKPILVVAAFLVEAVLLAALVFSAIGGPTDGIAIRAKDALIEASDQSNVTTEVVIARVVAPSDAWVVVQSDDGTGAPGAIMGVTRVSAGEALNLHMPIRSQGAVPIGAFITLVADLGQRGQLEYVPAQSAIEGSLGSMGGGTRASASKDKPFIADGSLVQTRIALKALTNIVQAGEAAIATATLDPRTGSVIASGVVAPGPSWLGVSLVTTSGAPGPVLGAVAVGAGSHESLTVPVGAVGRRQRLIAVLYVDLGVPNRFEFIPSNPNASPDAPYYAGGQTVAVPVARAP